MRREWDLQQRQQRLLTMQLFMLTDAPGRCLCIAVAAAAGGRLGAHMDASGNCSSVMLHYCSQTHARSSRELAAAAAAVICRGVNASSSRMLVKFCVTMHVLTAELTFVH